MRPAIGGSRPIIVFSTVLLPDPLPPTIAKISALPISASMPLCKMWPAYPTARSGTLILLAPAISNTERVRAYREHRVDRDDPPDRRDNRRLRRRADAGGAALGAQPAVTADERDERAERERLQRADREIRRRDRLLSLRHVRVDRNVQKGSRDTEPAHHGECAAVDVKHRRQEAHRDYTRQHEKFVGRYAKRGERIDLVVALHRRQASCEARARAAGEHDRGENWRQFANRRDSDQVGDVDSSAKGPELQRADEGENGAHQDIHDRDDDERAT